MMPDFDWKKHQTQAFLELTHIIHTRQVPNALLFHGNENSKRKKAAFFLAKGCNCLKNSKTACNNCTSCHKIDASSHPDILLIDLEKEKKSISISQIRDTGLAITSKPNEAKWRMVLILNADRMNPQAQNALLKMVEEPPEKTFFILIAEKINLLLPTIISRCRKIRFRSLSDRHIEHCLTADFKVNTHMAHIVSRTADCNLKKALMYLNLDFDDRHDGIDWVRRRKTLIQALSDILLAGAGTSLSKGLILSQKISLDSDRFDDTMAVMKTFFRDLMIFQHGRDQIVNLDFLNTIKDITLAVKSVFFPEWLENLFETEKRIASNTTPRLVLDKFFLNIARTKMSENI